jgi:hypothetical protein
VVGPAVAVANHLATFDGTTGKLIKDGGAVPAGDVVGPGGAVANHLAVFDGATGKLLKDGGVPATGSGDVVGPAVAVDGHLAKFDGTTGKLVKDGGVAPSGDFVGPGSAVDGHVMLFDGATGKLGKDGGAPTAGALVLLEQHTAAASAQLDFTTAISATYDEYLIELVGVLPVTSGANLLCRVSTNGGSSYDSSANYYSALFIFSNTAAGGTVQQNAATSIQVFAAVENTVLPGGVHGSIRMFNPGSTVIRTQFMLALCASRTADAAFGSGMALWNLATAVNALRFFFSTGNIASGTIRIYGIAK